MSQTSDSSSSRELIAFRIDGREFCVDIMQVRDIRGWTPATPLPHSPNYVRGVINLRGAVLPVVDLAARLGFKPSEPTVRQRHHGDAGRHPDRGPAGGCRVRHPDRDRSRYPADARSCFRARQDVPSRCSGDRRAHDQHDRDRSYPSARQSPWQRNGQQRRRQLSEREDARRDPRPRCNRRKQSLCRGTSSSPRRTSGRSHRPCIRTPAFTCPSPRRRWFTPGLREAVARPRAGKLPRIIVS